MARVKFHQFFCPVCKRYWGEESSGLADEKVCGPICAQTQAITDLAVRVEQALYHLAWAMTGKTK